MSDHAADAMDNLARVWRALEEWDQERPRSLPFGDGRAQLYMGAMEIPLIALRSKAPVRPEAERLAAWIPTLAGLGLALECVEVGRNYKINRRGTSEYVGRILPDALKLHAERALGLGPGVFRALVSFYLALPRE